MSTSTPGEEPYPETLPDFEPFPLCTLPEPFRRYVSESARALVCDPAMVAVPLLVAAAAAVGNSRRVRLKHRWTEPAVLWAATINKSGDSKSPAQDRGIVHVHRRHERIINDHRKEMAKYAAALAEWKQRPKEGRGAEPEKPPPCQRILVEDTTIEALAVRLDESRRGLLLARDELVGWFRSFDQYRNGKGSDVANWLKIHGARSLTVDRKTGDKTLLYVRHAAVCITGTIQPMTFRRALTPEFYDNGLAARLLVTYPPRVRRRWSDAEVDPALERLVEVVFDRLFDLRPDYDGDGEVVPKELALSPAARDLWVEFYNEVGDDQFDRRDDNLNAAWSKLLGYAARLALVLHLVRVAAGDKTADPNLIDELSIASGLELARWFGRETERVYRMLAETDEEREQRELCELVQAKGGAMTVRALMRCCRKYPTSEAAEKALKGLTDAGLGRWTQPESNAGPGRPADRIFELSLGVDVDTNAESQGKT